MKVKCADVTGVYPGCNIQNDWPSLEAVGGLTNRTSFNLSEVFTMCVCVGVLPGGLSRAQQSRVVLLCSPRELCRLLLCEKIQLGEYTVRDAWEK